MRTLLGLLATLVTLSGALLGQTQTLCLDRESNFGSESKCWFVNLRVDHPDGITLRRIMSYGATLADGTTFELYLRTGNQAATGADRTNPAVWELKRSGWARSRNTFEQPINVLPLYFPPGNHGLAIHRSRGAGRQAVYPNRIQVAHIAGFGQLTSHGSTEQLFDGLVENHSYAGCLDFTPGLFDTTLNIGAKVDLDDVVTNLTVSPLDSNGAGNGSGMFTRTYAGPQTVTLTAPTQVGFAAFRYWTVDGEPQAEGQTTLRFTTAETHDVIAQYYTRVFVAVEAQLDGSPFAMPNGFACSPKISTDNEELGPRAGP